MSAAAGPLGAGERLDLSGCLRKLSAAVDADGAVRYRLALQAPPSAPRAKGAPPEPRPIERHELNRWIGQRLRLEFLDAIHCVHCGRKTAKSYNQGYCYPCCQRLARCDLCIVRPRLCHYHQGTCREEDWAQAHCMAEHIVYLANTSGVKAGLTRGSQIPERWLDQGAVQALPVIRLQTRQQSGFAEELLHRWVSGATRWRAMLDEVAPVDLSAERGRLLERAAEGLAGLRARFGAQAVQTLPDEAVREFRYPVQAWPAERKALRLERLRAVEGRLLGIKGQYLMLDCGVLNVRAAAGFHVRCRARRG